MKIRPATRPLGEMSVFELRDFIRFEIFYGSRDLERLLWNADSN